MREYAKYFNPEKSGARYALVVTYASEPQGEKWSPTRTIEMMNGLLESAGMERALGEVLLRVKDIKGPLEDGWEDKVKTMSVDIWNLM